MLEQNSKHIKDPLKIIDTLDSVIKKLSGQCRPKATTDEVFQLNEITKAIERLKISGASVPDEIRKLKIELTVVVTEHEKVMTILRSIEIRLAHTITDLPPGKSLLAENAWQEIEVWVLAGHKLPNKWSWRKIRLEVHPKETNFLPFASGRRLLDTPGEGRKILAEEASKKYNRIRMLCPEVAGLEQRI